MNEKGNKILSVENLKISFKTDNGLVQAVRDVSFDLYKGETLCIVGESGSGKSVTSKAIMGILSGNAIIDNGSIIYEGEDLTKISEEEFHRIRGNKIGMIFQDPLSSLNPIMRIGKQITEAVILSGNHLKKMYFDLISNELIAYKNAQTLFKINRKKILYEAELKFNEYKKDGLNNNKTEKQQHKKILKDASRQILKEKIAYKKSLPDLKKDLLKSKKNAKIRVKEYKKQLIIQRESELAALSIKKLHSNELKTAKKEINRNFKKQIKISKEEARENALQIMKEVGIKEPERRFKQYPFEFSGGMRQRIVISIALTANPEILICDEPTTALDVTIQAQILELINNLKKNRNLSCIFITHDLGVVANMADRVAVMYAGKIVEYGTVEEIFYNPRHPYTWALLSSIPDVESKEKLDAIPGTPPNMVNPPVGDAFALRSKYAMKIDFEQEPPFFKISDTHYAATWLEHEFAPKVEMPKIVAERIANSLNKEVK